MQAAHSLVWALASAQRRHDTKADMNKGGHENKGGAVMPSKSLDRYALQIVLTLVATHAEIL